MTFKSFIRRTAERLFGIHIFRVLPRGVDQFKDIQSEFSDYQMNVIFDVGANTGQSAKAYATSFAKAHIHSFEPIKESFALLEKSVFSFHHVHCHHLALGLENGFVQMISDGVSPMNRQMKQTTAEASRASNSTERVKIVSLDSFCADNAIPHISYLKIDTEGMDREVLKGAYSMLSREAIDFVEVEAGMNPDNLHHAPFEDLKSGLESHGFRLFGIYEQVSEWPTWAPHLRRVNAVFLSGAMIAIKSSQELISKSSR
jgi:FkbM family methyltransferase